MVKFKNILTKHIFTLPEEKAIEIIKQAPDIYEVVSGLDKDIILVDIKPEINLSELKDIYNIVVDEEESANKKAPSVKASSPKAVGKKKTKNTNKKEKSK